MSKTNSIVVYTSDEAAINAARLYADSIKIGASNRDKNRELPFEELKLYAESGLLGLVVPKAYGGSGISTAALTEIFKIISAADGAIGQIPQNHHYFVKMIELAGSEEQKTFFFNEVLNGKQFANAMAERGNLTLKDMSTRLVKDPFSGNYRLSGTKYYCTGSLFASWIPTVVFDPNGIIVAALIPSDAAGVTIVDDWSGIGQRTTASGTIKFDNVEVAAKYIIPMGHIFEGRHYFSAFGQIMHAAIDVGIAKAALEDAAVFVRDKTRPYHESGLKRAADEPYLISRFGELGIGLHAAEALLEKASAAIDAARSHLDDHTAGQAVIAVDSVKYFASQYVIQATNALFEVAGTASMDEKYNLDRHWRNGRIHTLHDPARWKLHHIGNYYLNQQYPTTTF